MIKSQTFSTQGNDPEHSCAMAVQKPNIVSQKPERVAAADYAKQQQNQQPPPPLLSPPPGPTMCLVAGAQPFMLVNQTFLAGINHYDAGHNGICGSVQPNTFHDAHVDLSGKSKQHETLWCIPPKKKMIDQAAG